MLRPNSGRSLIFRETLPQDIGDQTARSIDRMCYEARTKDYMQNQLAEETFSWETSILPTVEFKERTLDRFDVFRALILTLKIGLLRDNISSSQRYLSPSGNLPGIHHLEMTVLDNSVI